MDTYIDIIETRFQYLSPFSAHSIEIWGENFPTVEHAYHAARYILSLERDKILCAGSPLEAWRISQALKKKKDILNPNFDKDKIMEELFRAKIEQHPDIVDILKETWDTEILKKYDTDYYWGTWKDGSWQNKMWKLWMKLRDEINKED